MNSIDTYTADMPTTLSLWTASTASQAIEAPATGYAIQVQDVPHLGERIMVSVVTPNGVHAVFLDGEQSDQFARLIASARLQLAAGQTGSRH